MYYVYVCLYVIYFPSSYTKSQDFHFIRNSFENLLVKCSLKTRILKWKRSTCQVKEVK